MKKSKKIKWLRDMWKADSVRLTAERNAFEEALGEKESECDALQTRLDIAIKMLIVSKDTIELLQGDCHTLLAELSKIRGEK